MCLEFFFFYWYAFISWYGRQIITDRYGDNIEFGWDEHGYAPYIDF